MRTTLAAALLLAAGAAASIPTAAVSATDDGTDFGAAWSWGNNQNGWDGQIVNASSTTITPVEVFNIPTMGTGWVVGAGESRAWKGKASFFGGPANVKSKFSISGGGYVVFDAWSDWTGAAYVSCEVVSNDSYTCGPNRGWPGTVPTDAMISWTFDER